MKKFGYSSREISNAVDISEKEVNRILKLAHT